MAITCPQCGHQYDVTLFTFDREICCVCGERFDIAEGHRWQLPEPIEGGLVDIGGVLHVGDDPLGGAVEALKRLSDSGIAIRFVTNTSRTTREKLAARLRRMGFEIDADRLFTAPLATRKFIEQRQLRPFLLIHPELTEEFAGMNCQPANAVVVGDAGRAFNYDNLNSAFRILMDGGQLISMGGNRYFREADGLSLDMGPFVEALRHASGVEPIVIGKPSATFFRQALDDMGVVAARAVMIGDDLENDIGGCQAAGIRGILVRTGKYRPSVESSKKQTPYKIVDDFAAAVAEILIARKQS